MGCWARNRIRVDQIFLLMKKQSESNILVLDPDLQVFARVENVTREKLRTVARAWNIPSGHDMKDTIRNLSDAGLLRTAEVQPTTITIGELKQMIKHIPDDTQISLDVDGFLYLGEGSLGEYGIQFR